MQMEIATGVMSSLLLKMAELLTDEYSLQRGLRGEVMFLKAELESMQAAMERVSEAPVNDNQVNIWASEVRELSYDIEDSIDQFMVRVHVHPSTTPEGFKGFIARSLRLLAEVKTRHQIATEIRDMRTLVKEVADRRNRYKVDSSVTTASTAPEIDHRLHGIYEESAKLVAISGPREDLAELLMVREGASKKLKVISIVGVGGLGKTTLANVMYRQLRGQFECSAFVPVSLKPDLKRILCSILRQVSEQIYTNIETWDVVEIINKIRQVLEYKRYFIIVDDIWDESAWNLINDALVDNNCGSRVITTTRVAGVAASCCSLNGGTVYKLKPLSHDYSKKLFYERIFGHEDSCYPELKEISEKILRKCYGVPLAIITIASLLANKPRNINQWDIVHSSIGSGTEKFPSIESMRQILSISYYDLPSHLKPCLLYLSIFPEDYTILTDHISHLPSTVVQLRRLMHLYIEPSVLLPPGIGNMESLQLLTSVSVSSCANFTKELGSLTELRVLHISLDGTLHESHKNPLVDSLCNLKKIQELHIDSTGISNEFVVDLAWFPQYLKSFLGRVPRLPRWMSPLLSDLTTLVITLDMIQQEDFQNLGGLPFLQFLCLTVDSAEERIITSTDQGKFHSLSEFHFHNDKMGLIFAQGSMQNLKTLEVTFRVRERKDAYGDFDFGLENLSVKHVIARIRCTGSTVCEVEDADLALRKAIDLNPNHPKLEVIRYYEDEMLEDGQHWGKTLVEEDNEKVVLQRRGPWGGDRGSTRDIMVAPQSLKSVKICSAAVVDAISFSYLDRYGREHSMPFWGGVGGMIRTIDLAPSEYVKEVSGTYGLCSPHPDVVITSLTLVTNLCSYGPFGQPTGTPFHTRVDKTASIVGFFGRSGIYLDAIGVYVRPSKS
ncbi:uncharacterized protein LOC8068739 [Sorghum bicolor]|uniref:uncharacterized protein LOC8068739 n=1 Tax=Sorghum bicolor TaxID=4558 RepID=UPI000B42608B|nr:uncharacterized protein LOC8068739 [Sorghum bicolor]|eukprot:XP_021317581.1 uncharacterized protein LOC8068739 [Sorghum bicolor]